MISRFAVLLALLAALVVWERSLALGELALRDASKRVGRLISSEQAAAMQGEVAAVEIATSTGSYVYYRLGGMWRCASYWFAPAKESDVQALVDRLFAAEGNVQSDDPARAADYGIGTPATRRVTFHGSDAVEQEPDGSLAFRGDPLYAVDLGQEIPGRSGCYARLPGEDEVWAVDANPIPLLAVAPGSRRPPLVDPHVVPAVWPGQGRHVARIRVERPGAGAFELALVPREVTPDELRAGKRPYAWTVLEPEGRAVAEGLCVAFAVFLQRAPFDEVFPQASRDELGFDRPIAEVTLLPNEGDPLPLTIGARRPDGRAALLNPHTQCIYLLAAPVVDLVAPRFELLSTDAQENPWEPYLRHE